ncbi:hypothetical protein FA95DRAFT_1553788 [Auriscalpium vulgare]|uniref:Uncharacterized protein n=1 Tax=Auriscalpium vulgare TaxID=40419 RepID=A0ACB8S8K4_9AGAM|nr:hypothetical protein FA95DRAFT_1553788 [Auriscalpium vulgare]
MSDAGSLTPIPATDQTAVQYAGDWNNGNKKNPFPFTNAPSANVTVSFHGTKIQANGFWKPDGEQSFMSVTMDDKDPVVTVVQASDGNTPITLFDSGELSCGSHTMALTLTEPKTAMGIEGFAFEPCVFAAEPSGSTSVISTPVSSSSPTASAVGSQDGNTSSLASSSHSHIGLIVGVAVGAVVGLLLLLLGLLLFMRRRKGSLSFQMQNAPSAEFLQSADFVRKTSLETLPEARLPETSTGAVKPSRGSVYPDEKADKSYLDLQPEVDEVGYVHGYLADSKEWEQRQEQYDAERGRARTTSEYLPRYQPSASGS